MPVVSMNYLLEAGVHFGHQTKRWNPKMKEYIFAARDDIYIIDLQKTAKKIEEAYIALNKIVADGGKVLFVGTKKQAQEASKDEATRSEMFYINERWLGGTLTNFKTIRKRIYRIEDIEKMEKDGVFEVLPKKEVIQIKKEYDKLVKYLGGIRDMKKVPEALIIVDPRKENSAIREARRLNIPVFGIVDTNCDPDDVDFVIPGNDDAVRAVKVILGVLTNAINEATGGKMTDYLTEEDKNKVAKATAARELRETEAAKVVVETPAVVVEEPIVEAVKEEIKEEKATKEVVKKAPVKKAVVKEEKATKEVVKKTVAKKAVIKEEKPAKEVVKKAPAKKVEKEVKTVAKKTTTKKTK